MYKKKNFIAVIPARKGSKGVENKNIKKINGHPLIAYSIIAALKSKYIDEVYVSTNCNKIKKISIKYGAQIISRPEKLSNDIIMPDSAVTHSINHIVEFLKKKVDNIVFLQPTSPLRSKKDLDNAIVSFSNFKCDALFSAVDLHPCLWSEKKNRDSKPQNYNPFKRIRRQDGQISVVENGSFYISNKKTYLKNDNRFGIKNRSFLMNYLCLTQIDNIEEFKIIEAILKSKEFRYLNLIKP